MIEASDLICLAVFVAEWPWRREAVVVERGAHPGPQRRRLGARAFLLTASELHSR